MYVTGIGYEVAKWIAMLGGTVIMACRSEDDTMKVPNYRFTNIAKRPTLYTIRARFSYVMKKSNSVNLNHALVRSCYQSSLDNTCIIVF